MTKQAAITTTYIDRDKSGDQSQLFKKNKNNVILLKNKHKKKQIPQP